MFKKKQNKTTTTKKNQKTKNLQHIKITCGAFVITSA
jgi:hypothetical protein